MKNLANNFIPSGSMPALVSISFRVKQSQKILNVHAQ